MNEVLERLKEELDMFGDNHSQPCRPGANSLNVSLVPKINVETPVV